MPTLIKTIDFINKQIGNLRQNNFVIEINADPASINNEKIRFLYYFLNNYENLYLISIIGIPYCLMPDADDHIVYLNDPTRNFKKIKQCSQCKYALQCPGWDTRMSEKKIIARPVIDIPNEVVFEITTACNLACKTCSIDKSKPENIDFKTVEKILLEAIQLGVKAVRFTGGEPLLHRKIKDMLLLAKRNKFYVLLNTNATVLSREMLKVIGQNVDNVLVSIQGYNQETNNRLTCSKIDFRVKLKNILALKSNVPTLRAGTVISKTMLNNFPEYLKILRHTGINTWELYRPINQLCSKEYLITKKELLKTTQTIMKLKHRGLNIKIANPVPFCICPDISIGASTIIGALADDGNSRIVLDAKGYFKPSYFISKSLGTNLAKAWEHPFLRILKANTYLPFTCRSCNYLKWCKGGSRIIAKLTTGNYFSADPLLMQKK